MSKNNNVAKQLFGLPGLSLLFATVITLSSCEKQNVTPQTSPDMVQGDPDEPKPPKDGHGGRVSAQDSTSTPYVKGSMK